MEDKKYSLVDDINLITDVDKEVLQQIINKYTLVLKDVYQRHENCKIDIGIGIIEFNFDVGFNCQFKINPQVCRKSGEDLKRVISDSLKEKMKFTYKSYFQNY